MTVGIVYVTMDDTNHYERPDEGRDYEKRVQGYCPTCDGPIEPHYGEPFASCECGTQEWYK